MSDENTTYLPIDRLSELEGGRIKNIIMRGQRRFYNPVSQKRNKAFVDYRRKHTIIKAIDVQTALGYNNTQMPIHVTVVNYYGYPLLSTFVEPRAPVKRWHTDVHGIDEDIMDRKINRGETLTYDELLQELDVLFPANSIMVSHHIKLDIRFLGLSFDKLNEKLTLYDTQKLARFKQDGLYFRASLKSAMKRYFNIDIQKNTRNSLEGARCSMILFRAFQDEYKPL